MLRETIDWLTSHGLPIIAGLVALIVVVAILDRPRRPRTHRVLRACDRTALDAIARA